MSQFSINTGLFPQLGLGSEAEGRQGSDDNAHADSTEVSHDGEQSMIESPQVVSTPEGPIVEVQQ